MNSLSSVNSKLVEAISGYVPGLQTFPSSSGDSESKRRLIVHNNCKVLMYCTKYDLVLTVILASSVAGLLWTKRKSKIDGALKVVSSACHQIFRVYLAHQTWNHMPILRAEENTMDNPFVMNTNTVVESVAGIIQLLFDRDLSIALNAISNAISNHLKMNKHQNSEIIHTTVKYSSSPLYQKLTNSKSEWSYSQIISLYVTNTSEKAEISLPTPETPKIDRFE